MPFTRPQALAGLLILLLVGLAVYYPALHRSFVYDDILVVRDNEFIAHPGNLLHLYGKQYLFDAGEQTYRPVVTATYILDHLVWQRDPFGYSLTNLLIHVTGAWLLMLTLATGFPRQKWLGPLSALLYLVHPALVETAIPPSNREQILSVALMLATAWAWRRGRDRASRLRWFGPLFLFVACFTLEWAVFTPLILAAWAWTEGDSAKSAAGSAAPEFLAVGLYVFSLFAVQPRLPNETPWLGGGPLGGLWAFGSLFWKYVRIALLPFGLRPTYTYAAPPVVLGLLGQVALWATGIAAAAGLARRRPWALGLGVFLVGLAPVSHVLMPFWIPLAERYLALPLLGGLPLLAAAALRIRRPWGVAVLLLAAAGFGLLARQYALAWSDGRALWSKATQLEPHDSRAWANYAASLASYGERQAAVSAYRRTWEESLARGWVSFKQPLHLAQALAAAGQAAEGCRLLVDEARRLTTDREWLLAAGSVCQQAGDPEAAHKAWAAVLQHDSGDCDAWAGLCSLGGELMADRVHEALQRCPDDGRLWLLIADRHAAAGDATRAMPALRQALKSKQAATLRAPILAVLQRLKTNRADRKEPMSGG